MERRSVRPGSIEAVILVKAARHDAACLGAFAHQELPFDKLVEALVRRRRRDLMPIFRVMFALIEERPALTFEGIDRCELEIGWPQDSSRFDLALEAVERDQFYIFPHQKVKALIRDRAEAANAEMEPYDTLAGRR